MLQKRADPPGKCRQIPFDAMLTFQVQPGAGGRFGLFDGPD